LAMVFAVHVCGATTSEATMGLFDKIKGAVNMVTGGAATVDIQYAEIATAGGIVPVRVTVTSKGTAIPSKGVFVDFTGLERVFISKRDERKFDEDYLREEPHAAQAFQLCGEFTLAPGETKVFDGSITVPVNVQPSFAGKYAQNMYQLRGRLEAKGNDPDSGYKPIRIVTPS